MIWDALHRTWLYFIYVNGEGNVMDVSLHALQHAPRWRLTLTLWECTCKARECHNVDTVSRLWSSYWDQSQEWLQLIIRRVRRQLSISRRKKKMVYEENTSVLSMYIYIYIYFIPIPTTSPCTVIMVAWLLALKSFRFIISPFLSPYDESKYTWLTHKSSWLAFNDELFSFTLSRKQSS